MKTTLELPDDLVKDIKLRAIHEGMKLKDAVAQLLRKGLAAPAGGSPTKVKADKTMLKRRRELTRKFVSGEWGVELVGFETEQGVDRLKARRRTAG